MIVGFEVLGGIGLLWRAAWAVFGRTTALRSAVAERKHSLEVPGHGDKAPLAANLVETAQQELAKAHHRFDDAEHRFGGLFAQAVKLLALRSAQAPRHPLGR